MKEKFLLLIIVIISTLNTSALLGQVESSRLTLKDHLQQIEAIKTQQTLTVVETEFIDQVISVYHQFDKDQNIEKFNRSYRNLIMQYEDKVDFLKFRKKPISETSQEPQITSPIASQPSGKDGISDDIFDKETTCLNSDFENGALTGWDLDYAIIEQEIEWISIPPLPPLPMPTGNIVINWQGTSDIGNQNGNAGNHAIMGPGSGTDPNTGGNVQRVFPGGGQYSMRLGDEKIEEGNYNACQAKASYTFTITPQNSLFVYHYAVVLQDPGHSASEQPFLKIKLTVDGTEISCGEYYQAAAGNAQGYSTYGQHSSGDPIRYKDWETMSIALMSYIGQTATIEFLTSDCTQTGHFGYAYIDAECSAMEDLGSQEINCSNPTSVIYGPEGADSYVWSGPGIVGSNTGQNVTVNQEGTYIVHVVPPQGENCAYDLEVEVTGGTGDIDVDIIASETTVCLGTGINFELDYTASPNLSNLTFYWDFGDGNTATGETTSHTFTNAGEYTVKITISDPTMECDATSTIHISVGTGATVDFDFDNVCEGAEMEFTDHSTGTGGAAITAWEWDFGDGNTSTSQNPKHTYAEPGNYEVSLTASIGGACPSTDSKIVTVYPNPAADISTDVVCVGEITELSDNSSISSGSITSWSWDLGDGTTSTDASLSHTYPDNNNYTVTLTVTSDKGCKDTKTLEIEFSDRPTANFSAQNACRGEEVELNSTSTTPTGTVTVWGWDIGNNGTIDYTTETAYHTFTSEGTFDVTLIIANSNGCKDTIKKQVTIHPTPVAAFDWDDVCYNTNMEFTNTSTVGTGNTITNWDWDFGNNLTSTSENPTTNYPQDGTYQVSLKVTSDNGCSNTVVNDVTVFPLPVANFNPIDICIGVPTAFTDGASISSGSITAWNWDFGDGNNSNQKNPTHLYTNNGSYEVVLEVTSDKGCTAFEKKEVNVWENPEASFTGIDLEGCPVLCPTLTSTAVVAAPSSISEYKWTLSNGNEYFGETITECFDNQGSTTAFFNVKLEVTTNKGCKNSFQENNYIMVHPSPKADYNFKPEEIDILNAEVNFFNTSKNADSYEWDFGPLGVSYEENPFLDFGEDPRSYVVQLVAFSQAGCSDTIRKLIRVLDKLIFYVPNTFTPDGDSYNDYFTPIFTSGFDPLTYSLAIYNRWGETLFESFDSKIGWDGTYDGKIVPDGTYVWKIRFRHTNHDEWQEHLGHVNVVR